MPRQKYNDQTVTHIIALVNGTQNGVTFVKDTRYGIDHYGDATLGGVAWWRYALANGFARIMEPIEYPAFNYTDGRLDGNPIPPKRRYVLINTTTITTNQLFGLFRQSEVFGRPIVNYESDGKSRRLIFGVEIPRDANNNLLIPTWITNNLDKIVAHGDHDAVVGFLADNTNYHFVHYHVLSELTIVCSNGEVQGLEFNNVR